MTSILRYARIAGACAIITLLSAGQIRAQVVPLNPEPSMAEYTHYPLFQTGAVAPRVMIILDNSGSMNYPAYGDDQESWPYGKTILAPYEGKVCSEFSGQVSSGTDDGQQQKNTGQIKLCNGTDARTLLDIDLGKDDDTYSNIVNNKPVACSTQEAMMAGIRFADVTVPRQVDGVPVVVSKAYIEFTARASDGGVNFTKAALTLKITAEAKDNPLTLDKTINNISIRPNTAASVTWNVPAVAWTDGQKYQTPDLTTMVQELVNRPGWNDGQAMLFKIDYVSGNGGRTVHSLESNAQLAPRLVIEYKPCRITTYYGYFDPTSRYSSDGSVFVRDASGPWDGNFLNFLSMRRGDVLRKAVVGGLSTSRTGGGNATQIGITEKTSPYGDYRRYYAKAGVSPWNDAWYFVTDGSIEVRTTHEWNATELGTFQIKVEKDPIAEADEFGPDGELAGVLQKVGDRAQWGNAYFLEGSDLTKGKGEIAYAMNQNMANMITTIKNKPFSTNTPLSEVLYAVTQYFKQEDAEISGYPASAIGPFNDERDPYHSRENTELEETCAQGFCLLLTDGMSSKDQRIPAYLKGYDTSQDPLIEYFPSDGTSFARDVALYMRTTDLRSSSVGIDELPGVQNVILYVVYAMGNNPDARELLRQAAINGGFYDSNGNNRPDKQIEWDKNDDDIPDNYFEAKDGKKLEEQLMNAILAILQRAGSGTAVSVLATKGEGEGTLVQAIFNPSEATEEGEVKWTGMLHSLWVDDHGQIREDTVADYKLDTDADERIRFNVNADTGDTIIQRFRGDEEDPYDPTVQLEELKAIWSAGEKLAETDPMFRKIYTYSGDGTEADPNVNFTRFSNDFWGLMSVMWLLGVNDNVVWSYLGVDETSRALNLMKWITGYPDIASSYYGTVSLRHRTLDDGTLWKLGDIIHSTPTSTAQPLADYDLLYGDASYFDYYMRNRNRETVVFVGSNAGMLHAFTGWVYDGDTFKSPYDITGYFNYRSDISAGNVDIGKELWAFIPQCLLPHLKWLADTRYSHVNYIDLRPRVFDARIFTPSPQHPNGWGSVLVCGMGFAAGMKIPVNPNHPDPASRTTLYPTFFAIDITDPRNPALLWERTFPNLGMSSNYPNLMKVGDKWMLAIGSGPTTMEGNVPEVAGQPHPASLIVVDLKTGGNTAQGGLKKIFTLPGGNAFTNEPVTLDKGMNYNVDAVYVAANYNDKTSRVFRLTIPQKDVTEFKPWGTDGNPPQYIDNPADPKWTITNLLKSPLPITASGSVSIDRKDNAWVYLGTGRYLSQTDKTTDDQNYIIGIKDPFFNPDLPDCNYTYPAVTCEINTLGTADNPLTDLFDADEYTVYGRDDVQGPDGTVSFDNMLTEARRNVYQGWYRRLMREEGSPSERVVNKGALLGGLLLKPTFTPNSDPCGFGGTSRLFAVYYETGTAFFRKVFMEDTGEGPIMDVIDLGDGLASSLSMHSGRQQGGKVYIQKSTGEILEVDVDPPFKIKSGPLYWLDDGYY